MPYFQNELLISGSVPKGGGSTESPTSSLVLWLTQVFGIIKAAIFRWKLLLFYGDKLSIKVYPTGSMYGLFIYI